MSRIRIYDSTTTTLLGTVQDVLTAARTERLNSDNILTFTAPLTTALEPLIAGGNVAELDGDYFDLVYYRKGQDPDGSLVVEVECEHVSYRLNDPDYDLEFFTQTGTPTAILTELLDGTGFTVGTVEPTASVTYSAQEKMSRRMLLMELVATVAGEVEFDQFEISILNARGSTTPVDLTATRDIEVIDKVYNGREKDSAGNPLVSYTCSLIRPVAVALGDVVAIDYPAIDIDVELRVVSITRNPYNRYEVAFEIGNFIPGLADDAYRIETSTLAKGKTYYGARISPENGFESIRSDKTARGVFNADTFALQVGDGSGSNWTNKVYFDPATGKYIFDGELSATLISSLQGQFGTVIVNNLFSEKAVIAELTVDQIDTSDMVQRYLEENKDPVGYWRGYDQNIEFIEALYAGDLTPTDYQSWDGFTDSPVLTATYPYQAITKYLTYYYLVYCDNPLWANGSYIYATSGTLRWRTWSGTDWNATENEGTLIKNSIEEANNDVYGQSTMTSVFFSRTTPPETGDNVVQVTNRAGDPVYWIDAEHIGTGITTDVTDYPVMRYVYNGPDGIGNVKLKIYHEIDPVTGYATPRMVWGAGSGTGDNGKAFLQKDGDSFKISYFATGGGDLSAGTEVSIDVGDDGIVMNPSPYGLSTTYTTDTPEAITITTTETTAYLSSFDIERQSRVLIHFTAKVDVPAARRVSAKIYVEDRIQGMIPEQLCTAVGPWTFSFQMISEVLPAGTRNVKIKLYCDTGTCTIGKDQGQLNVTSVTSAGELINYTPTISVGLTVPAMPTTSEGASVISPTPTSISVGLTVPDMPTVTEATE